MPNICLFADTPSGQAIQGGEGLLLLSSFIENIDNDSTNSTRLMPFAPYRWSDSTNTTSRRFADQLVSGAGYASPADDDVCNLWIHINDFTDTTVTNVDFTLTMGAVTKSKTFAIDTASFGTDEELYNNTSLIFYGQGHDIEFDFSSNENKTEEKVTHNNDGSYTIAAGGITGTTGDRGSTHGYLGLNGDYDVGTKIITYFTGKNIPNICLFADTNYGSSISESYKGVYIASDVGTNNTTFNQRLTLYGSYRFSRNDAPDYTSTYRMETANPATNNPFGIACLNDAINYRYEVEIVSLEADLTLTIGLKLFDNDTDDLIGSATFSQVYNKMDTSVSLVGCRKVLFYGQYKDITFTYNISHVT